MVDANECSHIDDVITAHRPWNCIFNAGCWILRNAALAVLKLAEAALYIPIGVLDVARAALDVAIMAVEAAKSLVDIAKGALTFVQNALRGLNLLLDGAKAALSAVQGLVAFGLELLNKILSFTVGGLFNIRQALFSVKVSTANPFAFEVKLSGTILGIRFENVGFSFDFSRASSAFTALVDFLVDRVKGALGLRHRRDVIKRIDALQGSHEWPTIQREMHQAVDLALRLPVRRRSDEGETALATATTPASTPAAARSGETNSSTASSGPDDDRSSSSSTPGSAQPSTPSECGCYTAAEAYIEHAVDALRIVLAHQVDLQNTQQRALQDNENIQAEIEAFDISMLRVDPDILRDLGVNESVETLASHDNVLGTELVKALKTGFDNQAKETVAMVNAQASWFEQWLTGLSGAHFGCSAIECSGVADCIGATFEWIDSQLARKISADDVCAAGSTDSPFLATTGCAEYNSEQHDREAAFQLLANSTRAVFDGIYAEDANDHSNITGATAALAAFSGAFGIMRVHASAGSIFCGIAPTINVQPVGLIRQAGEVATFSCVASGFPVPTLRWLRNGLVVRATSNPAFEDAGNESTLHGNGGRNSSVRQPSPSHTNTLKLDGLSVEDNGEYVCVASNVRGSAASKPAKLEVYTHAGYGLSVWFEVTEGASAASVDVDIWLARVASFLGVAKARITDLHLLWNNSALPPVKFESELHALHQAMDPPRDPANAVLQFTVLAPALSRSTSAIFESSLGTVRANVDQILCSARFTGDEADILTTSGSHRVIDVSAKYVAKLRVREGSTPPTVYTIPDTRHNGALNSSVQSAAAVYSLEQATDSNGNTVRNLFGVDADSGAVLLDRPLDREEATGYDIDVRVNYSLSSPAAIDYGRSCTGLDAIDWTADVVRTIFPSAARAYAEALAAGEYDCGSVISPLLVEHTPAVGSELTAAYFRLQTACTTMCSPNGFGCGKLVGTCPGVPAVARLTDHVLSSHATTGGGISFSDPQKCAGVSTALKRFSACTLPESRGCNTFTMDAARDDIKLNDNHDCRALKRYQDAVAGCRSDRVRIDEPLAKEVAANCSTPECASVCASCSRSFMPRVTASLASAMSTNLAETCSSVAQLVVGLGGDCGFGKVVHESDRDSIVDILKAVQTEHCSENDLSDVYRLSPMPDAGRLNAVAAILGSNDHTVDCNAELVPFLDAVAMCRLDDIDKLSLDAVVRKCVQACQPKGFRCNAPQVSEVFALHIEVEDVNDNPPVFDAAYNLTVFEDDGDVGESRVLVVAAASDLDSGELFYSITEHRLSLRPCSNDGASPSISPCEWGAYQPGAPASIVIDQYTGAITTTYLDFDNLFADVELTVAAYDELDPTDGNSAETTVTIHVKDRNDQVPVLYLDLGVGDNIVVREDIGVGDDIVGPNGNPAIAYAIDTDVLDACANCLSFAISGGSTIFSLDPSSGRLSVSSPLDFERKHKYTLEISVTDNVGHKDAKVLVVTVVDVDEFGFFGPDLSETYFPVLTTPASLPPPLTENLLEDTDGWLWIRGTKQFIQ